MRKYSFISGGLVLAALGLVSWGFKGHRAVATIAQHHLTSNIAYTVSAYLKGEQMEGVSTWADENRDPKTAPWHYINLPLGLTRDAFVKAVQESDNNVYTAILKTEVTLLVNLGAAYPNQLLTLALKGEAKALSSSIEGKEVTITGQVIDYKGKPEIIISDPNLMTVK